MRLRALLAVAVIAWLALPTQAIAATRIDRRVTRDEQMLPKGFVPAVARLHETGRYFVRLKTPSLVSRGGASLSAAAQRSATADVLRSQESAIAAVQSLGGSVVYRYARLVNAFSATMTAVDAARIAERADVKAVEPVPIVVKANSTSVPFIGATKVWNKLGVRGQGMTVALVDTGIDYTHADFGGPGTVHAYNSNNPKVIEPGTFPTAKVIGGFDFVGGNYDVIDDDPTNDTPKPDPDPLDVDGHGTHTAGTCCGLGVKGAIGPGVAPRAKLLAIKVWDDGNSTADVLVAGYEYAVDPNGDGNMKDAADVLSFSGGVDWGPPTSTEAVAAEAVVKAGTVFVAAAGNAGNQPTTSQGGYILGTPAAAPDVIAVGASIDQFRAQQLTVNAPTGVDLPDGGPIVDQSWSPPFDTNITGDLVDAREFDPPADPSGVPVATDRELCDSTPAGSPFAGKLVLVFKASFSSGDCFVEDKVIHAQEAGAVGVVIWDGFGGLPSDIGTGGNESQVTIPAVDLSGKDSAALAAAISPDAPTSYNTVTGNVTLGAHESLIPGYADRMTEFSSEGPARISSALKPDISAPGFDITSAGVGTGDGAATFSGTSMATPHVAGVATLLRQIHPSWSPDAIKALIMNQATQDLANLDGSSPVPATVIGSGRVQAFESATTTNLATPGSLSFKLRGVSDLTTIVKKVVVTNNDTQGHDYKVSGSVRYTDFSSKFASVRVAVNDEQLASSRTFHLGGGDSADVFVELTLDPSKVPSWQQEFGWYYFNPNVDGNVDFTQTGKGGEQFHVPWHVSGLASAGTALNKSSLDLTGGPATLKATDPGNGGLSYADLYLLGSTDLKNKKFAGTEADLRAIGARSFTGSSIDGVAAGVPTGLDPYGGNTWQEFLTADNEPTEPIEFAAASYGVHNTTETTEVDVLIDVGADGVFADPDLGADALLVKVAGGVDGVSGGLVCLFKLPSEFSACDADYFADYANYNGSVWGLPVDAGALGLTNAIHTLSYEIFTTSGVFAGDLPSDLVFDTAGAFDTATGTYAQTLDVTAPALTFSNQVIGGFWHGDGGPVTVSVGSAQPGDDPSILAVFPNDTPKHQIAIITTST